MSDPNGSEGRKGTHVQRTDRKQKRVHVNAPFNTDETSTTSKHEETSLTTPATTCDAVSQPCSDPKTQQLIVTSATSSPLTPALSDGSSDRLASEVSGQLDGATYEDAATRRALKRSHEDMLEQERNAPAASATRKVANTPSGPSDLHHHMRLSITELAAIQKRHVISDRSMEYLGTGHPSKRLALARSALVTGMAASESGAMSANVIDLTDSNHGSSSTPTGQQLVSHLHGLPGELRNRIYEHIGLTGIRLDLRTLPEPALAVAFPSLKDELHSVIFSKSKLRVPVYSDFRDDDPPVLSARVTAKMKPKKFTRKFNSSHLTAGVIAISPDSWVMNVDPRFVVIKHICFRILESEYPHKHLCDFFLNVRMVGGKPKVKYLTLGSDSRTSKSNMKPMCSLGAARARHFAAADGFEGYNWEQAQQIAKSFVSAIDARSRYDEKYGKVMLK